MELYEKYKGTVNFIVVDLDSKMSKKHKKLKDKFYENFIPHVTIIDAKGDVVYDRSGEVHTNTLSKILDKSLK